MELPCHSASCSATSLNSPHGAGQFRLATCSDCESGVEAAAAVATGASELRTDGSSVNGNMTSTKKLSAARPTTSGKPTRPPKQYPGERNPLIMAALLPGQQDNIADFVAMISRARVTA